MPSQKLRPVQKSAPGLIDVLVYKAPLRTAKDDVFCNIFPNFRKIRFDISLELSRDYKTFSHA